VSARSSGSGFWTVRARKTAVLKVRSDEVKMKVVPGLNLLSTTPRRRIRSGGKVPKFLTLM
jgi:hypothetical protein